MVHAMKANGKMGSKTERGIIGTAIACAEKVKTKNLTGVRNGVPCLQASSSAARVWSGSEYPDVCGRSVLAQT